MHVTRIVIKNKKSNILEVDKKYLSVKGMAKSKLYIMKALVSTMALMLNHIEAIQRLANDSTYQKPSFKNQNENCSEMFMIVLNCRFHTFSLKLRDSELAWNIKSGKSIKLQ